MATKNNGERFSQTLTFKGLMIAALTLLLLIPNAMIQNLIRERQERSSETIYTIDEKWSLSQTVCAPILVVPFTTTYLDGNSKSSTQEHNLYITPEDVTVDALLFPEERYYGIYKTILYKSENHISGRFAPVDKVKIDNSVMHFDKAYVSLGISDLKGVTKQPDFKLNGKPCTVETVGNGGAAYGKQLQINLREAVGKESEEGYTFDCHLDLNGSSYINFVPIGRTTQVNVAGSWKAPGFIGSFSPQYKLTDKGFEASWSILSFNRDIPEQWTDKAGSHLPEIRETLFGVNLVDMVDHYQQNMRAAKYSLMFIVLTFVAFFFVEVLTKKRIHPIQYLLVGIALILFYSLLLSISEQINFAIAYIIASVATIALITAYAHSIFKNRSQTGILAFILSILYVFFYVILQLEDMALLIGSIGLFTILAIIMFISKKIRWYKAEEAEA
ncbi:cell envelope integrity protein CreD [Bacteroidia bacterium]|nr:cell envelope integrity protein CreD [Bacteroidia bacterium]